MSAESTIRSEGMLDRVDRRKLVGPAVDRRRRRAAADRRRHPRRRTSSPSTTCSPSCGRRRSSGIAAVGMTFVTLTGQLLLALDRADRDHLRRSCSRSRCRNGWPVALAALVTIAAAVAIGLDPGRDRRRRHEPDRHDARRRRRPLRPRERAHGQPHRQDAHRRRRLDRHRAALRHPDADHRLRGADGRHDARALEDPFGRRVMLVGANRAAATATGLRVGTTTFLAFVLATASRRALRDLCHRRSSARRRPRTSRASPSTPSRRCSSAARRSRAARARRCAPRSAPSSSPCSRTSCCSATTLRRPPARSRASS